MDTQRFFSRLRRAMQGRNKQDQSGAVMVEFAIILPLLLLILFGIIEFGLVLYNKQVITNASREGARAGIVAREPRNDVDYIEDVISKYVEDNLITFGEIKEPVINLKGYNENAAFGDELEVEVGFEYTFLVGGAGTFIKQEPDEGSDENEGEVSWATIPLKAKTLMRYE